MNAETNAWGATAAEWRKLRSPSLVAICTFTTLGFFGLWWFYATWSELKREYQDEKMHPVWHTLTQLVPVYSYFRFHAHMEAIYSVANTYKVAVPLSAGTLTLIYFISTVSNRALDRVIDQFAQQVPAELLFVLVGLFLLSFFGFGLVTAFGQDVLNRSWRVSPGGGVACPIHPVQWLLVILGSLLWVMILMGLFISVTEPSGMTPV